MKLFYKLLLPSLLFSTIASAQIGYKPGYVVPLKGDTIRGNVDYKLWERNPITFSFKDNSGNVTEYSGAKALAFGVNGLEEFEYYNLTLSADEVDPNKLSIKYDSTTVVGNVFLKVLARGEHLTLYSYNDELKTRFIIREKGSKQPVELSRHLYMDQNTSTVRSIDRYKVELGIYAEQFGKNSATLTAQIQRARYDRRDLIGIVNKINGGSATTIAVTHSNSVRFFAGASLITATLKYTGAIDLAYNVIDHQTYLPQISVGADILQGSAAGRFVLRGELSAYSGKIKAMSSNSSKEMTITSINIHPQVLFNVFNTQPVKVYLGAGIVARYTKYSNVKFEVTQAAWGTNQTNTKSETVWTAFPLKAGVILSNKVDIYGCYTPPSNFENNSYNKLNGKLSFLQFGVNYLFGKK